MYPVQRVTVGRPECDQGTDMRGSPVEPENGGESNVSVRRVAWKGVLLTDG